MWVWVLAIVRVRVNATQFQKYFLPSINGQTNFQ